MESLDKSFAAVAKYDVPCLIVIALVLFIPNEIAQEFAIEGIRKKFLGPLWIAFLLFLLIAISNHIRVIKNFVWRYFVCSALKLLYPSRCLRSGIKQSRKRYYSFQYSSAEADSQVGYMVVSSNGNLIGYTDDSGQKIALPREHTGEIVGDKKFQFPPWGRVDWQDVFSGDRSSGRWGIEAS